MKLLKTTRLLLIFFLAVAVSAACKKDEPEQIQPDSSPVQQLTADDNSLEGNLNAAFADVALVLSTATKMIDVPCGATLDSVVEQQNKIYYYLTYDGPNCQETRYRTGKIQFMIKKQDNWWDKNTRVDVDFIDYEVTNVFDNSKTMTNGSADYTNVSGGIPALLGNGINTVIYKIIADFEITFDDDPAARDRKVHKMMVYSGSPDNLQLAVNGFGNQQGQNNLMAWGTDREGRKFRIQCDESVVFRQSCQWLPSSGILQYSYPEDDLQATVTYGYNDNNEPISGSECPTRYKLDWSQQGQSGTLFLPL